MIYCWLGRYQLLDKLPSLSLYHFEITGLRCVHKDLLFACCIMWVFLAVTNYKEDLILLSILAHDLLLPCAPAGGGLKKNLPTEIKGDEGSSKRKTEMNENSCTNEISLLCDFIAQLEIGDGWCDEMEWRCCWLPNVRMTHLLPLMAAHGPTWQIQPLSYDSSPHSNEL